MNSKLYLAFDKLKNGLCPLYLYCNFNGKQLKISTGQKVSPDAWDPYAQRCKGRGEAVAGINNALLNLMSTVNTLYDNYPDKKALTPTILKQLYQAHKGITKPVGPVDDFYLLLDQYLTGSQGLKSAGYLRSFGQARLALKQFAPILKVTAINKEFYNNYLLYLINELGISNNTVKTHTRTIRAVMEYADTLGVPVKKDYLRFRDLKTDTERLCLTWEELMKLWTLRVATEGKQKALDVFLFACFTGLRYSDIRSLTPANIKNGIVRFTQQKTRSKTTIALNDYALEIIERNQGGARCLPVISNFNTNVHIKELCRMAGIDQSVQRVVYKGVNRVEKTVPKWEMMSFHAARHTYATLSLEKGMDLITVSKNLGHRSIETTMVYVRMADQQRHDESRRVWKKND